MLLFCTHTHTHTHTQLLGLAVMIIGIWANVNQKKYVSISDDSGGIDQVSVLMIVIGIFVLIVGAVGTVGALFAGYLFGRIILMLVSTLIR